MGNLDQTVQSTTTDAAPADSCSSEKVFSLKDVLEMIGAKQIDERFDQLVAGGIRPSQLIDRAWPSTIIRHLNEFIADKISMDDIVEYIAKKDRDLLVTHLSELLIRGADATKLAEKLTLRDQLEYYDMLKFHGAKLNEERLLRYVRKHGNPESIAIVAIIVMDHGGDPSGLENLYKTCSEDWFLD